MYFDIKTSHPLLPITSPPRPAAAARHGQTQPALHRLFGSALTGMIDGSPDMSGVPDSLGLLTVNVYSSYGGLRSAYCTAVSSHPFLMSSSHNLVRTTSDPPHHHNSGHAALRKKRPAQKRRSSGLVLGGVYLISAPSRHSDPVLGKTPVTSALRGVGLNSPSRCRRAHHLPVFRPTT